MARSVLFAIALCIFSLISLQVLAGENPSQSGGGIIAGQENLEEKISSMRALLSLQDCGAQYALINADVYLQNALSTLEDSLEADGGIAPIYLALAEKYYSQAEGYFKIAQETCSSK